MINESRSFTRQVLTLFSLKHSENKSEADLEAFKKQIIYRQIGLVNTLRCHLRKQEIPTEIEKYFSKKELALLTTTQNIPNMLLLEQARQLHDALHSGYIEDFRHMQIDVRLTAMTDILGGCERIKKTDFPRQYSNYTSIFTWIFIIMLPYSLVQGMGMLTIVASTVIGFIFMVLETIGYYIETPFENHINDTPMTAICRGIEIDLLEMLGETDLPKPLQPVNGYLY